MGMSSGNFSISDKASIDALHVTIKEAISATNENSKSVKRLTTVAIGLAVVQAIAAVIQIWPTN